MFKGSYVPIDLPFKKTDANEEIPLEIRPDFTSFLH